MERQYEGCFLLRADISEEELAKEAAYIEEQISAAGGKIAGKELWGKKHLAYPIKKKTEAVYYLFYFKAAPEVMLSAEPQMRRRENILRHMFLQKKKLPEVKKEDDKNGGTEPK
ncbi:MAG: 30S ribosomal protein S6 [Candidatus Omnitrophica bacterium]|nr:30S ribosomal protein S6 [Candidatus Omnitrophota bacterium]